MSFLLPKLSSKKEVDQAIKSTAEKVLVLRFGRDEDPICLQLDDILSKTSSDLSKMAAIYLVDVDQTPVYTHYFDISYIPSTVFFFNGQHMKVDYGSRRDTPATWLRWGSKVSISFSQSFSPCTVAISLLLRSSPT
ncbi:thioredoxin-like protein 4B isoform X2 [Hippopotamus amphibius kiboko]|uniref:thioredoxin-like protein 4B isoform X2 n=1 Tax=Hippopotamus amphibius kiboko TaxID=575201 RepID=UPI002594E38A|nr:thioredoxin-like protein 4B isoform X2 [Hippopotamus amphibius kiboko]